MDRIEHLRHVSRKLVRELGLFQLGQSRSGRSPQHWHALIEISKEEGMTISILSSLLLLSVSATSRIVNSLTKEGLVQTKEGTDKREKVLSLTQKGKEELVYIDKYSYSKILGAFAFLSDSEQEHIIEAIQKYGWALEQSRRLQDEVKITRLSKSQALRKQVLTMIEEIQNKELLVQVPKVLNQSVLQAEKTFNFGGTSNFWVAFDGKGEVVGSIGLKKLTPSQGEIQKFFVTKQFRGKKVAQKLLKRLVAGAKKHEFSELYLGTVESSHYAQRFYETYGFSKISQEELPKDFQRNALDKVFYKGKISTLLESLSLKI